MCTNMSTALSIDTHQDADSKHFVELRLTHRQSVEADMIEINRIDTHFKNPFASTETSFRWTI